MNSKIGSGFVFHERFEKASHRFQYPLYFYLFDLDELESLQKKMLGFAYNRASLASLHDADYLHRGQAPIRQKLDSYLESRGLKNDITQILLLTSARFLNHVFNPVSFFLCYGKDRKLRCILMEVSNTFDERHLYILDEPLPDSSPKTFHAKASKEFHVSPFFDRSGEYDARFRIQDDEIDIHLNLIKEGKTALVSRMYGKMKPLKAGHFYRTLLRFPLTTLMTIPRIHWQALKLYFGKKIKHYKKPPPKNHMTIRTARPKLKHRFAMKMIGSVLKRIQKGKLVLLLPDGRAAVFGGKEPGIEATVRVHHYDFFWRVLKSAGIGLGESYMVRDWESPDLVAVLNLLIENKPYLETKDKWLGFLNAAGDRLFHFIRANTLRRSQKNIREHYDLSNDFFKLFLDSNMLYSCAYFDQPSTTLEEAQISKIHRLIEMARIQKGQHILEIGFGWGGFAIEAARATGCHVTGITLSKEQLEFARERVRKEGLEQQIEFHLCDYRSLKGQFDRIVSIEMLEAVGHQYFDDYFRACDRLLKPEGLGVFQVITIPDQRYEQYRRGCDFIQKHIFPGGHLPSMTALCQSMSRASSFTVEAVENIGDHYGETLKRWRENFLRRRSEIKALGFNETFIRKWEYYFVYCESAYRMRYLNNLQFAVTRAGNRSLVRNEETRHERSLEQE